MTFTIIGLEVWLILTVILNMNSVYIDTAAGQIDLLPTSSLKD